MLDCDPNSQSSSDAVRTLALVAVSLILFADAKCTVQYVLYVQQGQQLSPTNWHNADTPLALFHFAGEDR